MISGLEEMWAIRWSAAIRIRRSLVPEDGVGGAVAGPVQHLAGCGRGRRAPRRRASGRVTVDVRAPAAEAARDALQRRRRRPRGCRCAASARPRSWSSRSASSSKLASRSAATPIAATSAPECSTMISTRPRWSMCWWVTIDQLEVVDRVAALGELALQLVERLARVGPGVDQGQRLVLEQVAVDPPDRERRRDAQAVDAGQRRLLERLPPGSARSRPDQPQHLVALAPPCPRGRPATRG